MSKLRLNTVSTVDAICASLENDIFSLHYGPGVKIAEKELTERYGVSRNAVREAIAFFIANGLLEKVANKGVFVRAISDGDIREIFHLRELLESEAIRMIIASGTFPKELMDAANRVANSITDTDWLVSTRADMDFHKVLVQCSNSPRLIRLYESIQAEVKLCVYQSYEFAPNSSIQVRTENSAQHIRILDAMRNDDLESSLKQLSLHIDYAVKNYTQGFLNKEQLA